MKITETTIPTDLDRYLATNSAADITSTASYVERGGALVTPHSLTGLRKLRQPLQAKISALKQGAVLRERLEILALYLDECAAERATLSPAIREAAFALLYFLKGFDRIPDSVPEIGLLDDALVVQVVLDRHAAALRAHWQRRRRLMDN
ncbi:MAG: YkvA family protein [Opitutaceae bacterium]|nr:YkvA family protein [Opitutaceae bacterium]